MATNTTQLDIFRYDELADRCLNNPELVSRVIDAFKQGFQSDLLLLEEHIGKSEAQLAGKIAHRMKGSAGNAAAYRLQEKAARMEIAAGDKTSEELNVLLDELTQEWTEFQEEVNLAEGSPAAI